MRKLLLAFSFVLLFFGCGKSGDSPGPAVVNPPAAPSKAALTLPAQNAVCTTGTIVSQTESSISFSWGASDNTDSYELTITNLLTGTAVSQVTALTQISVTLLRNTPYSWSVTSKSAKSSGSAQSDTWKFYNAGPGVVSYAPFPAEISSPLYGQHIDAASGTVNLVWAGSSTGKNITGYDVYLGTTGLPAILKSNVTDMFLDNVAVVSGTTYYWRIITKDSNGNSSDSGLFEFTVN